MLKPSRKADAPAAPTPLDTLLSLVDDDMDATNEMILSRLTSDVPAIPQVARHLIESGGKRIRPLLTLACAKQFGAESDRSVKLAAAVEFIHSATLLHDDVVDGSPERRGKIAANLVYGNKTAVLVGDFLFSRAFELMVETDSLRVLGILSHAAAVIAEGEVMQLKTANNLDTTIDDYLKVIAAKTAALFAAAAAAGPALADEDATAEQALRTYGHHLGVAFQIADDVLDYTADVRAFGKQPGNDFAEGKMTAPVIFALKQPEADRAFWRRCLVERQILDGDLAVAKKFMEKHGCFKAAMDLARHHADLAIAALADLGDTAMTLALHDLPIYAITRVR